MLWQNVLSLIEKGEQSDIKFLANVDTEDALGPFVVAMANSKGGTIVIGLDIKNNHLRGTQIDKKFVEEMCRKWCRPQPGLEVETLLKNEKVLLIVKILVGNSPPYFYKRDCYGLEEQEKVFTLSVREVAEETWLEQAASNNADNRDVEKKVVLKLEPVLPEVDVSMLANVEIKEQSTLVSSGQHQQVFADSSVMMPQVFDESKLNARQIRAMEFLQKNKVIKNQQYRQLCGVSHKTAHLELIDLLRKGYINVQGSGRSTCYVLSLAPQQQINFPFDKEDKLKAGDHIV